MAFDLGPLGYQSTASAILVLVGAITVLTVLFQTTRVLLSTFVIPGTPIQTFGPKGSWAVVTGASDGIGKQYAIQLARAGYNIVLVSRTASKLSALETEIKTASPDVKVVSHAMDFGQDKQEDYNALEKLLTGLEYIAILINNVGLSHSIPVEFVETAPHEMEQIITINCLATLKVTQMVLPRMLPHKAGLILTMGSFGGLTPTPLLATYSGSKAFLQQWSTALASEVANKGITVHLVQSYLVTSSMSKVRRSNWQVPSEKQFVKSVLSKIGRRGGSIGYMYSGSPWWSHALIASVLIGVLGTMSGTLLEFNRKMQVSIRKRAVAKAGLKRAKEKKAS